MVKPSDAAVRGVDKPSGAHSQAVHQDAVVVLATSKTATAWMLPVLADAAMTHKGVAALMAGLLQVGRHPARKVG